MLVHLYGKIHVHFGFSRGANSSYFDVPELLDPLLVSICSFDLCFFKEGPNLEEEWAGLDDMLVYVK